MSTRASSPAWLPQQRLGGFGHGLVLALILVAIGFQLAAPSEGWAQVVTLALQAAVLIVAFHVSGIDAGITRVVAAISVVGTLIAAGILIRTGELDTLAGLSVGLVLVAVAPVAVIAGMVREFRAVGRVTLRTMFAVLSLYLLAGTAFAFAYGVIGELESQPFFSQPGASEDGANLLYFSFTTMTTTGFGDLTPAVSLGRSLSIVEVLFGQLYLVTVVALIVGNLGRARPARDGPRT